MMRKEEYLYIQRDMANIPPEKSIQANVIRHAQEDMKHILPTSPDPPGPGILSKIFHGIAVTMSEAVLPAIQKLIPQGAQEIANSLFIGTSNSYSPYGVTPKPLDIPEEPPVEVANYDVELATLDHEESVGHDR